VTENLWLSCWWFEGKVLPFWNEGFCLTSEGTFADLRIFPVTCLWCTSKPLEIYERSAALLVLIFHLNCLQASRGQEVQVTLSLENLLVTCWFRLLWLLLRFTEIRIGFRRVCRVEQGDYYL